MARAGLPGKRWMVERPVRPVRKTNLRRTLRHEGELSPS